LPKNISRIRYRRQWGPPPIGSPGIFPGPWADSQAVFALSGRRDNGFQRANVWLWKADEFIGKVLDRTIRGS